MEHRGGGDRARGPSRQQPVEPTGAVYPRDLLHAIADICVRHGLLLVSDETYGALTYGDIRSVSPASFPGLRDRTVSVHSFSKEYAMTGWRIGYLTGPAPMLRVMAVVQEQMASCVNSATQRAALAAVRGPQDCVDAMRRAYQKRRDLAWSGSADSGRCPRPDGAFYAFPDVLVTTTRDPGRAASLRSQGCGFARRGVRSPIGGFLVARTPPRTRIRPRATRLEAGLAFAARRG